MSKQILYQDDARKALEKGMDVLAEAVSITLGPKGRNVVLERKRGAPQIVNDGVTIAREIKLKNHLANTGIALIQQAASKTNDIAGDGTTTATVLAHAMLKQGMKNVASGSNPMSIKKGIEKATQFVVHKIVELSRPVEDSTAIAQVASISSGNDITIGKMIATAIEKVGREGVISLEEGKSIITELEITQGMQFDRGFISPYFITDTARMEAVLEKPYILLTDKKITLVQQELIPILEQVTKTGRPLLIIADDVEKEALATIVVNKLRGLLNVVAVKAPGFGDRRKALLEDIAILTKGQVMSEDVGLSFSQITLDMLGEARKVTVSKDSTTIIAQDNETDKQARCEQLRKQIEIADSVYEKDKLQERLAKLSGGVAVIKVGAVTETEMKEKKLRLEDAINATKAAIEEGIIAGGGSTYVHISSDLSQWAKENLSEDELIGATIVEKALYAPLTRIVKNAGQNGSSVVEKVKKSPANIGYDAIRGELVDMYQAGIIDPAKVTRSALQNAASIASMVLTTECIVVDKSNNNK